MSRPLKEDVQSSNLERFVKGLEATLFLPARLKNSGEGAFLLSERMSETSLDENVIFDMVSDASVLTCGCLISEKLAFECLGAHENKKSFQCPICGNNEAVLLAPILPLRRLYAQIQKYKANVSFDLSTSTSEVDRNDSVKSSKSRRKSLKTPLLQPAKKGSSYIESYSRLSPRSGRSKNKMSLLSLFQITALKIKDEDYQNAEDDLSTQFTIYESRLKDSNPNSIDKARSSFGSQNEAVDSDSHSQITSSSPRNTRPLGSSVGSASNYLSRTESQTSHRSGNTTTTTVADGGSIHSFPKTLKTHKSFTSLKASMVSSSSSFGTSPQHVPSPISIPKPSQVFGSSYPLDKLVANEYLGVSNGSNTPSSLYYPPNTGDSHRFQNTPKEEFSKEYRFASNFPVYRKRIQYPTQSSKVMSLLKRSDFIGTAISADATKFALIEDKKWVVYKIDPDSSNPPTLLCCGKNNGHYGINFENLKKLNSKFYTEEKLKIVLGDEETQDMVLKGNWTFEYCALGTNYFVIAGKRIIKIFDLQRQGKIVYTHNIGFPIRCIDISADDQFIACGLTGKDKLTDSEGSLIMLFEMFYEPDVSYNGSIYEESKANDNGMGMPSPVPYVYENKPIYAFSRANSSLITLHYKDPINNVKFSDDANYLSALTALESRFMVINISKPSEPRLVMKASRKLDTSYESEGITDLCFFGDNNKYLTVSSVAFNAPSLLLETRISNLKESQSVAHPRMLMKVEEIGSSIHKCCVSPRNDAFAFLNKKGSVYIMHINKNFERKRIVLAGDVMSATKKSEAASLRFSKDGYKLYVIDRKGVLYIEDFIAGTPQNHDVTKCKSIT